MPDLPVDPTGAHEVAPPPESDPVIQAETREHPAPDAQAGADGPK